MSKVEYPNRDALRKAHDIYLDTMCSFIIGCLGEDIIESELDIAASIDFGNIPYLIREYWNDSFEERFKRYDPYYEARSAIQLIVEGRNRASHPPWDLDSDFTRTQLFLIAELLGKINKPNEQREVEDIRDKLFSDDTAERLAELEERLKDVEGENAEYKKSLAGVEKHLETAKSEKLRYEKDNTTLSEQVDEKEKRVKKLSRQVKNAKTQNEKQKKNLAGTKQRLEESETAQVNYKERLQTTSKELKDTKKELAAAAAEKTEHKNDLKTILKELESVKVERNIFEERLAAMLKLLAITTIRNQEVQTIFPPFETDSTVRILDRRGINKKDYLLNLLEQKQPTIIYVQSEEKIEQLCRLVGPEKAEIIKEHNERTSEVEERETLERLESGELIAIVSDAPLSTLTSAHCVEHFVFCHLVPGLDEFFERCQPAFTSANNAYLHLIYNSREDIDGLNQWLVQKYPDRDVLKKLYPKLNRLSETNGGFIKTENLYSELDIAKLWIETGLAIFEELQLLKRNGEGIKLLPPAGKKLDESEIYLKGEKLKNETTNFQTFQLEQSIAQIWEEILEKLNIDSEQILRESSIYKTSSEVSGLDGDVPSSEQTGQDSSTPTTDDTLPEPTAIVPDDTDSTLIRESDAALHSRYGDTENVIDSNSTVQEVAKFTKTKARKKKPSIAERYVSETTEDSRNEMAVKVVELRINASGSKPLAWREIREKLDLKNDQFHKVIRLSEGYREAVIQRIKRLRAQDGGWEYSGKLEVLTGIELTESELE